MIGEPKPTQRQRLLEGRVATLEMSCREMQQEVSEMRDQLAMMRHHLSRPGEARRAPRDAVVLQ